MKKLLRNRPLLIIATAEAISSLGSWITMMAVFALVVFRGNGTVAQTSGILLAGLLPLLVFSPVAGWLADRFDRKWLMIGSELLSGLVVSGLFFVERLEFIYALLAMQAACTAMMGPARQSAVPLLVPRDELTQTNALLQQLSSLIRMSAPFVAGLVLTVLDPHQAILLDVCSFVVSAMLLSRLPMLRTTPIVAAHLIAATPAPENVSFLDVLRRMPLLQLLYGLAFSAVLVIMSFELFASIVTRDILKGDARLYGALVGIISLGTLLGALWLSWRKQAKDPWHDIFVGLLLLSVAPAAIAAVAWIATPQLAKVVLALGCLIAGIGNGITVVQVSTLLQTLVPQPVLGRASGCFQSIMVAAQLVALVAVPMLVPSVLAISTFFALAMLALWCFVLVGAGMRRWAIRAAPPGHDLTQST